MPPPPGGISVFALGLPRFSSQPLKFIIENDRNFDYSTSSGEQQ
jgi:hypothetical protein